MFVRRLLEKFDRMIVILKEVAGGQKRIERILEIMNQAELDLSAKVEILLGQNDSLLTTLTILKSEVDAANANGVDTAALQSISVKIDAEIAKNASALASLQGTPAVTAPAVTAPPAADAAPAAASSPADPSPAAS